MIPSIAHNECSELVTGIKNVSLLNHSLRIKITSVRLNFIMQPILGCKSLRKLLSYNNVSSTTIYK